MFLGCGMACGLPKHLMEITRTDSKPSRGRRIVRVEPPSTDMTKYSQLPHGLHPFFRPTSLLPESIPREKVFEPAIPKQENVIVKEVKEDAGI